MRFGRPREREAAGYSEKKLEAAAGARKERAMSGPDVRHRLRLSTSEAGARFRIFPPVHGIATPMRRGWRRGGGEGLRGVNSRGGLPQRDTPGD